MKNKGLFLKIFGGFGLLVLALSVLTIVFSFSIIRSHYDRRLATELEHLGRAMTPDILRLIDGPSAGLESFLIEEGKKIEARVTVIDPAGRVLADSERNPGGMESHRYRPEVAEALEGKISRSERFSYTVSDRMMYVGVPLKDGSGSVRAVLRLSLLTREVTMLLSDLRGGIFRAVLIVTVLALLAAFFFTVHLTRPIQSLVRVSQKVAGGDFKARAQIGRRDEFRVLAEGFNSMVDRLDTQFKGLVRGREELGNVIGAIREGLAVIGPDGRIFLTNAAFQKYFPKSAESGRHYSEIIRSATLQELIDRSRAEKSGRIAEMKIGDRFSLAATSYLPIQDEIVLLLHDVTERHRIDEMKRDFIVNASHELRTPLAAISGAVELLDNEDRIKDPGAMDILRRHVIRMRSIVDDLLKLGELESAETRLETGDVDLADLARKVVEMFAVRAGQKGLDLRIEAAPNLPFLKADGYKIEQLLINLVDNAVKYTDKGGVTVGLRVENNLMVMEVKDTGPGIAAEHRDRIFERFYRVDKSRSRILGGTGLGLSIVKRIVLLHGGTIDMRSEAGEGTAFIVRFPLAGAALP